MKKIIHDNGKYRYDSDRNVLIHYGVGHLDGGHSGRYEWGSGEDPYQHSNDYISRIAKYRESGMTDKKIAIALFGPYATTTQLRARESIYKNEYRKQLAAEASELRDKGLSYKQIMDTMNANHKDDDAYSELTSDSSVRTLLDNSIAENKKRVENTAEILKKELETKGFLDVGANAEYQLGVNKTTLEAALERLRMEGYEVYTRQMNYANDPKGQNKLTLSILCPPGTEYKEVYSDLDKVQQISDYYSDDDGDSFNRLKYPTSIDSDRIYIRYAEEGGIDLDGTIQLRRGVEDLDLGKSSYAQVRILTDDKLYLKGMAQYSDDIPDGYDIVFNTNKSEGTPKEKVFKEIKLDDPVNPFGAAIKANGQSYYEDSNGNKLLSAINKIKEEGDWLTQAKSLSSQFLAKQPLELIKKQLNLTYKDNYEQYDEILTINNVTLRKKMLNDLADQLDSAATSMKAAALPGQKTAVILPVPELKDTEIYDPNLPNGTKVSLVRFPHASIAEIPQLTVNNNVVAAIKRIGKNATDAVGISPKVAAQLSGADFDGDTVLVIPTNDKVRISAKKPYEELVNFDAKSQYKETAGMKYMTKANTNKEMGIISNLITDMQLRGANDEDLVKAIKHSMVVIDAYKHKLDYKQSEKDNDIASLKKKYQTWIDSDGKVHEGGASTLLSRRKQTVQVDESQGTPIVNVKSSKYYDSTKEDGSLIYKTSGRTYVDEKGNTVKAKENRSLILETADAYSLSTGTAQENLYAEYVNKTKSLANLCRKTAAETPSARKSSTAAKEYATEVASLESKLSKAKANSPRERQAQIVANTRMAAKVEDNPELKDDIKTYKKLATIELNNARYECGASGKNVRISITDKEWEAIQNNALATNKVEEIFSKCDEDQLLTRARPKSSTTLSDAKIAKIKALAACGYTNAEIAESIGCSVSTVSKKLNE
jgi:hypothetical protein